MYEEIDRPFKCIKRQQINNIKNANIKRFKRATRSRVDGVKIEFLQRILACDKNSKTNNNKKCPKDLPGTIMDYDPITNCPIQR